MKVAQRKNTSTPLAAWLNANGMTMREFGRRIGIPHSKFSGLVDGHATPALVVAYEIERLTQGEVPIESWLGITIAKTAMTKLRMLQPREFQPASFKEGGDTDERNSEEDIDSEASGEEAFSSDN